MLLGIVSGNFSMSGDDDRIMVAGFIPDMPASLSKKMKIGITGFEKFKLILAHLEHFLGDWLQSIDGQQVLHSNVDALLSRISSNSTVNNYLRPNKEFNF
jgi:hypothetical protein